MSTPFQNRLVGTVIVAAVAIIFLPDILDGDKQTYQEQFQQIPSAPSVDFKPENKPFPKEKLTELPKEELVDEQPIDQVLTDDKTQNQLSDSAIKVNPIESGTQVKDDVEETQRKEQVALTPAKAQANQAWVIQLGTFRHKNNVDELVKKLKNAGYTAFTRPINTKTGKLTKVFVGPELIKASLEKKLPALKKLTNVEGKVAKFSPTK
ncbi:SPOR domain-containing protein [Thalassotalea sp. G2M2-11]|uniref:SPOR domain-containing protein n=1 Tax=Thalassotalea sp. G2M2-11 TaxID=2787627 RepID=UPI0019D30FEC|nr:SPOR domain-containing protein [Thalassotalea sp. G2M2-11]